MQTLIIKNSRQMPLVFRHPWIFSRALVSIPDRLQAGEPVRIENEDGEFLGQGFFNSHSQIAVRLWSFDEKEKIDADFFARRIQSALRRRLSSIDSRTDAYRLINSENDWLPGLIVDRYADFLSVQFHTRGIERWRQEIIAALSAIIKPRGIFERSESLSRKTEGLGEKKQTIAGEVPDEIIIKENGLFFAVDLKTGQKTGFFLDQRDKRLALQKYVRGKSVLNCFAYSGGFSIYALAAGAKRVVSVDSSAGALKLLQRNLELNRLDNSKHEAVEADCLEYLKSIHPGEFDIIILDPPAYVKDRRRQKEGLKGYRHLNERAFSVLPEDGLLVTCSCSSHVSADEFRLAISQAVARSRRSAQIIAHFQNGPDHPLLPQFLESDYLKCLFLMMM